MTAEEFIEYCRGRVDDLVTCIGERDRALARVAELEAELKAKDLLLVAHRTQNHDLADRALTMLEKLKAKGRGEPIAPTGGEP